VAGEEGRVVNEELADEIDAVTAMGIADIRRALDEERIAHDETKRELARLKNGGFDPGDWSVWLEATNPAAWGGPFWLTRDVGEQTIVWMMSEDGAHEMAASYNQIWKATAALYDPTRTA
jgi:hypothetical protein